MALIAAFTKLTLQTSIRNISCTAISRIQVTPILCAEPLKKKKKLDPQIIKQREDRRKKKLEKQIRRLEKNARQLKPIEELEVPLTLLDEKDKRIRKLSPLSEENLEKRALLIKQWAKYKHQEKVSDFQTLDRLLQSQNRALDELRKESEELYQEAIQPDMTLLPITIKGPVATPPIKNYVSPDGDYIRENKKWD
ncbi:39S ribosomal protein L40, mitochondrial [Zeugodacus cucurbitae]|uniref:Large ribosomal subunit protein mL40 n=1 Tax=Zeugodacus cucurbitae TaxID=28588 RepID=A0A0A1X823_ZEUCU|nr:39S ribosomal protein L40, mitochondrial [Zeugodacus cucurbitae]XP_054092109.1 39S ribosomal protein L40, mitochondrial [Zeugodacus cucurbitae]